MGTRLAAEMPWGSCHLDQAGSRHFVPDTGPPSRATQHPAPQPRLGRHLAPTKDGVGVDLVCAQSTRAAAPPYPLP